MVLLCGRLLDAEVHIHDPRGEQMSRTDVEADIRETLGLVPEFFAEVPDILIEAEWELQSPHAVRDSDPEQVQGANRLGVSGATRCKYCVYYHTEAARLFGATEEEINEAALVAKNTMVWSTYLNTRAFDYDRFTKEFDQIAEHVREMMAVAV